MALLGTPLFNSARLIASTTRPVFLAGGIKPGNVGEAIAAARPFGIDLCSGVRTDGRLDERKLLELVDAQSRLAVVDQYLQQHHIL